MRVTTRVDQDTLARLSWHTMSRRNPPGLFITGTNTGVGKTYVGALIARAVRESGKRVGVYKPVASGCRKGAEGLICDDAVTLWQAAGCPGSLEAVCPQRFASPVAPHLAARDAGGEVDSAMLRSGLNYWTERSEFVLVEGAGGLMSPLSDDDYVADLAWDFAFPLLVVAPNLLGVINQTLQTLITAATFREGLQLAGIVLNHPAAPRGDDPSQSTNRRELEQRCVPPVLAQIPWQGESFDTRVDWFELGQPTA